MSAATSMSSMYQKRHAKLNIDSEQFAENFDKRPFYIEHDLIGHPLFELPAMAALSERLPHYFVEGEYGETGRPPSVPCPQAILNVAEQPTWVLLRQVQKDRLYGPLVDELLDQIQPLSERTHPSMQQREAFLFISSREAVTPFHFDPEHNFLLQITGRKTVQLWDPEDREVIPAQALDLYYAARRGNRDQPFRDEFLGRAWQGPLQPGQGLHFPLHAPHTVRTESDVSISLSITFRSVRSKQRAVVHTANGHARRLGFEPPGPGASPLWDKAAHLGYLAHQGVEQAHWLASRLRKRVETRLRVPPVGEQVPG